MNNDLRIPDMYPVNFMKTITLKVGNIVKHDGAPAGYSFEVEDGSGLIVNFDQFISADPLHSQKIILYAATGHVQYRRVMNQDPSITGCVGLMPPGNKALEYFIIEAYDELMAHMGKPLKRVIVKVKWSEKEE